MAFDVISCMRRVSVTAEVNSCQRRRPCPVALRSDRIAIGLRERQGRG
jgi:hypothetical protein